MKKLTIDKTGWKIRQGEISPAKFETLDDSQKISYLEQIFLIPTDERSVFEQVIIIRYLKQKYNFTITLPEINNHIQYQEVDDTDENLFHMNEWVFRIGEISLAKYQKLTSKEKVSHVEYLRKLSEQELSTNDKAILNMYHDTRTQNLKIAKQIFEKLVEPSLFETNEVEQLNDKKHVKDYLTKLFHIFNSHWESELKWAKSSDEFVSNTKSYMELSEKDTRYISAYKTLK